MSHVWMSHITRIHESRYKCYSSEWVMSHTWISYEVATISNLPKSVGHFCKRAPPKRSCYTWNTSEWVMCDMTRVHLWYDVVWLIEMLHISMSHVYTSHVTHVTHLNESCVTWLVYTCDMMWYDSFTCYISECHTYTRVTSHMLHIWMSHATHTWKCHAGWVTPHTRIWVTSPEQIAHDEGMLFS